MRRPPRPTVKRAPLEEQADEWFEFDSDLALGRGLRRRPTFYADEHIPDDLINQMRAHGLRVRTARDCRMQGRTDEHHAKLCASRGWVLVTRDLGFWNERRFPCRKTTPGMVILVADREDDLVRAMSYVWVAFAKHFPGEVWHGCKARATPEGVRLRMRGWPGRIVEYDLKLTPGGQLMAREGRGAVSGGNSEGT